MDKPDRPMTKADFESLMSALATAWNDGDHLIFDPETGIGEYTYRGQRQYHGVAIVQCADGRIRRWREYEYQSDLDWADFVGGSAFD